MSGKIIGFLCPSSSWGGLEMNVFKQALWLKEKGWKIIFYGTENTPLFNKFSHNEFPCRSIESESKLEDIISSFKLKKLLQEDNVTDILFHLNRNFLLVTLTKLLCPGKLRTYYQLHMQPGGNKKDAFHSFMYNKLDRFIVPLEMYAKKIKNISKIKHGNVMVVPFGIDLDRFTINRPKKNTARKLLNLSSEKFIIGVVGRIDPKKGQHILIEAAAILKKEGYDFNILLVGDRTLNENSGYDKQLDQLISTHRLIGQVHYRPHLEQIENGYAAIDLFVLTSLSETYGMVTIEAMASKLPIIATNSGGTSEIINDNKNGLLVKPEHPKELAGKLKILIDDQSLAQRLASQAENDAVNIYSKDAQIEKLEQIFSADYSD